jgi:hypothetical protein
VGGQLFANEAWMTLMRAIRILLPIAGALFLLHEARSRALGYSVNERRNKRIAIVASAVAFGSWFLFFNPSVRYPDYVHRHELFHHYLGAKYANELGYTRLYVCMSVAEVELGRGAEVRTSEIRDLATDSIVSIHDTPVLTDPTQCKSHFSPAKWDSFRRDIDWFQSVSRGSYWDNMRRDHGFNASPVWILSAKGFASLGSAGLVFFQLLSVIDILLLAATMLLLFWAFGWRVGAVATVFWGCNGVSDFHWLGGAFLRQEWLFLLVASLCLARKRRFGWAGFCLGWAALSRVFPVIFFAGWAIPITLHWIRRRRLHPDHKRLVLGCGLALCVLIPASVVVTRPTVFAEWIDRMQVVERTQLTDKMGLERILGHGWENRMRFVRDGDALDPFHAWRDSRNERHAQLLWLQLGIAGAIAGWMTWALRKRAPSWLGPPLALPLVMSLTNVSGYYYSMFLIGAVLVAVRRELGAVLLVGSSASQIIGLSFYWIDDRFAAQSWLFWILGLCLLLAGGRPAVARQPERQHSRAARTEVDLSPSSESDVGNERGTKLARRGVLLRAPDMDKPRSRCVS